MKISPLFEPVPQPPVCGLDPFDSDVKGFKLNQRGRRARGEVAALLSSKSYPKCEVRLDLPLLGVTLMAVSPAHGTAAR